MVFLFILEFSNRQMAIINHLNRIPAIKVLAANGSYAVIDLSAANPALTEVKNVEQYQKYIDDFLIKNSATVAYGGYNERRSLYDDAELFNDGDSEPRNIHLGTDLWAKAGTEVLAALSGTVHSFAFNAGKGNYGPTIILEHKIEGERFFTLYGHLSLEDIGELEIGERFESGAVIGKLGTAFENGGYAPHLHFQLILDIGDYFGDYPGVCSESDAEFYVNNCPDPNLMLKL